jgi:hypothetical protein
MFTQDVAEPHVDTCRALVSPQESDSQLFLHSILLGRRDHFVHPSVPGLCLQEQVDFEGVLPERQRKGVVIVQRLDTGCTKFGWGSDDAG